MPKTKIRPYPQALLEQMAETSSITSAHNIVTN